jgi:hypothetical protein
LAWVETIGGAWAVLVVFEVEVARLEVTASSWKVTGREGTAKSGSAGSIEAAKRATVVALEELLTIALVDVRSTMHFSKRPPAGWGA